MPTKRGVTGKGQVAARTGLGAALWQGLVSPRFTLALFLALIFLCLLGTLFAQSTTSVLPLEKIYEPELLYFLRLAGLTDIFHSVWFVFVLTLLVLNQVCVLMDRLPQAWLEVTDPGPVLSDQVWRKPEGLSAAEITTLVEREKFKELISKWCKGRVSAPQVVRDDGGRGELQLTAQEGRFSRLSGLVAHMGLLLIVLGGMLEGMNGFEGQVTLDEGARLSYIQILRGNSQKWPVLVEKGRPMAGFYEPGFEIELSRFKADFYENDKLRDQTSWLNFYEGGHGVASRQVNVNSPAVFKGLRFFQRDFSPTGQTKVTLEVRENIGVEGDDADESLPQNRTYSGLFPEKKYELEGASFRIEQIQQTEDLGLALEVEYQEEGKASARFWIFQKHPRYDQAHRKKSRYHFSMPAHARAVEPRYSATLRVSRNPGLGWILAGALLLTFGLMASAFFTLNRYWFVWKSGKIRIFGRSMRPTLFMPEFTKSAEQIRKRLERADPTGEVGDLEVRHGSH